MCKVVLVKGDDYRLKLNMSRGRRP
jgi:hypothetical protein